MLSKKFKLASKEIPYILDKGMTENSSLFLLKRIPDENGKTHFTCIVSKKIHKKANKRNRIKRRIFESVRLILKEFKDKIPGQKTILIPKKIILDKNFLEIKNDLLKTITNQK